MGDVTVDRYSVLATAAVVGIVLLIVAALAALGMTVANYAMPTAPVEVRLAVVIVVALVLSSIGGRSR